MQKAIFKTSYLALAVAGLAGTTNGAFAQAAPPSAQPAARAAEPAQTQPQSGLEDIIVTATKRDERLQSVPAAISAIGASALKDARITSVDALASASPSFNLSQDSPNQLQLNIRGIVTVKIPDGSAESSVGLFLDEVFISRNGSAFTDFYDLDRVEVIRGPQGVVLGKNVVGGAISVITAKPKFNPAASLTFSYGNYRSLMVNGFVTGPLSKNWAARVAFQVRRHDGYNFNTLLGTPLDNLESYQGRAELLYKSDDGHFRGLLTADYGEDHNDGTIRATDDDPAIAGIAATSASIYRNAAATRLSPREDRTPQREYNNRQAYGAMLRLDWDAFTNASLTSITGYRHSNSTLAFNQLGFGSPPAILDTFIQTTEKPTTFSQELRLASTNADSPFDYLVGGYYANEKVIRPQYHTASTYAPIPTLSGKYLYDVTSRSTTVGVFAQVGYKFFDIFKLTAGLRYTHDDKSGTKFATCLADGGDGQCITPYQGPAGSSFNVAYGKKWGAVTPQAILEVHPTKSIMLYARYAQGYKGGGWDSVPGNATLAVIPFNPEHVTNYELGLKSDLFNRRLRFNVAAFQMDFRDLQASRTDATCLCLIVSNAGSAKIKGLELEATAVPVPGLTLNASATFLDPKYIDYVESATKIYSGNVMQRTPKTKYVIGGEYAADLGGGWGRALAGRVSYTYQSKIFWGPENITKQDGYGLLDASIRLHPENAQWTISVWGKNLTNKLYSISGTPFLGDIVNTWGTPKTYGADVTFNF